MCVCAHVRVVASLEDSDHLRSFLMKDQFPIAYLLVLSFSDKASDFQLAFLKTHSTYKFILF